MYKRILSLLLVIAIMMSSLPVQAWAADDESFQEYSTSSIDIPGDGPFAYGENNMAGEANSTVVQVAAGSGHSLALKSDGTVWAWGNNSNGQLGDGTTINRSIPVQVLDLSGVTAIAGGVFYSLALKSDGTVWAWGEGSYGKLGDGTTDDHHIPIQVSGLSDVTALAGNAYHSMALKSDGTVWAWGSNTAGVLGTGTTSYVPAQVTGLTDVIAIAAGFQYSMALRSDGVVYAWGDNHFGQLGRNNVMWSYVPLRLEELSGITAIAAGLHHSLALKQDGIIQAWGSSSYNQLGDGTGVSHYNPLPVQQLTGITSIRAGGSHSLALKSDATVWAWGRNSVGQLGDGTTEMRSIPIQVSGLSNITGISTQNAHNLALKSDGTVWAWGGNGSGQLGDGTTEDRLTPVQVLGLDSVSQNLKKSGAFKYAGQLEVTDENGREIDSTATYYYDDAYFLQDPTTYNPRLSTMSLCLQLSSWPSIDEETWTNKTRNARVLLTGETSYGVSAALDSGIGFKEFQQNDAVWTYPPTNESIGIVAANKTIVDEADGNKPYTLIALSVRGGGYYNEWASNFKLGASGQHEGWSAAKDNVLSFLDSYIDTYRISGDIKLWIVGYSRGGATANLVAGALNSDYNLPARVTLNPEAGLFCYTFEAPQGAMIFQDDGTHLNIHNVVNINDIVPLIAPTEWQFSRFNTDRDYILPNYKVSSYENYLLAMLRRYTELDGASSEEYRIREYTRRFGFELTNEPPYFTLIIEDMEMPQHDMLRDTITNLSQSIGSRGNYVNGLQDGFMEVMEKTLGYGAEGKLIELFQVMADRLSDSYFQGFRNALGTAINPMIDASLRYEAVKSDFAVFVEACAQEVGINATEQFVATLVDTFAGLIAQRPDLFLKFIDNGFVSGHFIQAHYPEITLAWLMSQDTNYNSAATYGSAPHTGRLISVNCPVDVNIYDSDYSLVASIIDDLPQYEHTGYGIIHSVNANGEKTFYLPSDMDYTVEMRASDVGTLSFAVREYDTAGGHTSRLINYYDIPIAAQDSLTAIIPGIGSDELTVHLPNGSSADYRLLNAASAEIIPDEEMTGVEIEDQYYQVSVSSENDCGFVYGGGRFLKGSFAQTQALAISGSSFIGWYVNDLLVSTEEVYRFAVREDTALVANFTVAAEHELDIAYSRGGRVSLVEGFYSEGARIGLVAEPKAGYAFSHWTTSVGGTFSDPNSAETVFTMPGNGTVLTAHFSEDGSPIASSIDILTALTEEQTANEPLDLLVTDIDMANSSSSERALVGGETITISYETTNLAQKTRHVQYILALHDRNDALIDVRIEEGSILPGFTENTSLCLPIPAYMKGLHLRVMIWDTDRNDAPTTCQIITMDGLSYR